MIGVKELCIHIVVKQQEKKCSKKVVTEEVCKNKKNIFFL